MNTEYGIGNRRTIHGQHSLGKSGSLACYAEINCGFYENKDYREVLFNVRNSMQKFGVKEINIHGGLNRARGCVTVPGFDRLSPAGAGTSGREGAPDFHAVLKVFKDIGARIILSGAEPLLPADFLTQYPEAANVSNGILWRFFEARTEEIFRVFPEIDGIQFHLFETDQVNDQDVFREFRWAGDGPYYDASLGVHPVYRFPLQYYSASDYFTELFAAFSRAAQKAGREFSLLTFSHYPEQENLLIKALEGLDPAFPVTLDHKCQPGDWSPHRPMNTCLLTLKDRGPCKIKFDGIGEYWGQAHMPYCCPEEIQGRLQYALLQNQTLQTVGMRVGWG
ncbi:MAG: hypothetical protein LBS62_12215, partial [Clostridiales bacterium]|nr:hypothetical protein [Clostridiales bacterium]